MANEAASMLTETAFVLPGTKLKIPRWAVLATLGGVILIVLLAKKQGAAIGTTEEAATDEEGTAPGGADYQSLIDELMDFMNNWRMEATRTRPQSPIRQVWGCLPPSGTPSLHSKNGSCRR
jgi:hypothetical protein